MEEALKHCEDAVISDLDAPEVLQPGIGALDFPALSVTAQLAFVLESAVADILSIGDNQLRATLFEPRSQRIGVISSIGDDSAQMGARASTTNAEPSHAGACSPRADIRQSARTQVALRQERPCRLPPPCTSSLSRDVFCRLPSPLFRRDECGVEKGFFPIQQSALVQQGP